MRNSKIKNPFIEFNGIRYYRDNQGWRASACKGHERLARAVWIHHHGPIPPNHVVACADGDKWNNDLANLELRPKGSWNLGAMDELRRAPRWTGERERKLRSLHAMGLSQVAIGAILGVPQGTISHKIRRLNNGTRHFWTEERSAELRSRFEAGESADQIAAAMGCKRPVIYGRLKHLGLSIRGKFWTVERVQQLNELIASGLTFAAAAKELGCSIGAAYGKHSRMKAPA